MKITVEGSPAEMAEWMQVMAGKPAAHKIEQPNWTHPAPYDEEPPTLDDAPLPGCESCQRFGRDRESCRRANCAYSAVNAAAQLGD